MDSREKLLNDISRMFQSDGNRRIFKKYIDYIRFPFFKNFEKKLKVKFDYPITFLVGLNGSGKSSLLQALYGSPEGNSIASYWYTTALDPIKDLKTNRHCFIYSFKTEYTQKQVEVLKERIQNKDKKTGKINPDYWEPARPKKRYNMAKFEGGYDSREASKTRWNLLNKDVLYMDFRYSLSAYDKYFYFGEKPNTKTLKTKQDIIRKYSSRLKKSFEHDQKTTFNRYRFSREPSKLSKVEIETIEFILEKKYTEAKITEHNYYDRSKGFAIRYKTNSLSYSEAYAGSGEIAVVKLVHDIINAENYSLILLDEPETSLHPTAQKRLIDFILEQIKKKKLQVVISTHSPDIIEGMPNKAVKILYENIESSKINILEKVDPVNAFVHIGRSFSDKKVLVVEDILAKLIVEKVLENKNNEGIFDVKFFPSGESIIKEEHMVVYSKEKNSKHFVLFDGDQRCDKIDISKIPERDRGLGSLQEKIKSITDINNIKFNSDTDRDDQKIELMLNYLEYHEQNVFFLPKNIPEEIIWDNDVLDGAQISEVNKNEIKGESNLKKRFSLFAKYILGGSSSEHVLMANNYFLTKWITKKDESYKEIAAIIDIIKSR